MPDESGFPQVTWRLDADTVAFVWKSTRQVFGNKLWHSDMDEAFPVDLQDEIERRGGDLFDVVMDAAQGYSLGRDPSLIYPALRREMARFGVDLEFAPHPRHGDVLARARDIEAGRPAPGPDTWVFDAATVGRLWSSVEGHSRHLSDAFPDGFVDDLEMAYGGEAFLPLSRVTDELSEDADPSLWFRGLRTVCAGLGIEVSFADHPDYGDVLARATALGADLGDPPGARGLPRTDPGP